MLALPNIGQSTMLARPTAVALSDILNPAVCIQIEAN